MSRETLDRLKAQIAEQMRMHGENAIDSGYLRNTAIPIISRQIRGDALLPEELAALANVYPAWQADESVTVDDLRSFDGMLWKVVQGHATQSDWTPTVARSLWTRTAPPDVIPEWVQPLGAHDAYPIGYKVTHNGELYESLHPANVWIPGTDSSLWQIIQDVSSETIPEWTPWDGHNENLYQIGDEVMYNGQHWIATVGDNHWQPGVFGWELV